MAARVRPTRPFSADRLADQLRLSFLWFAGQALWEAVLTVILPLLVLRAVGNAQKTVALSLVSFLGTLLASAVHPLAGWASDRTRTAIGRRRPYLLAGGLLAALGLVWLAVGQGYGQIIGAVLVLQFGYNTALAAYQAYIPELSPAEGRGTASGFLGVMSTSGALVGAIGASLLVHGTAYRYMLLLLAALLLAAIAVTVWGLPEAPPTPAAPRRPGGLSRFFAVYRDFLWVVVTRALVMLAFYTLLGYLAYYLKDVAGLVHYATDTSVVVAVTILFAACTTLWAGWRSDRIGRRGLVSAAGALMGIGALAFLLVRGLVPILAVGALFGIGYGAYISVDWALVTDVLPDASRIARDMGFWGLAITGPQVLAPVIAGAVFVLVHGNAAYSWIFGFTCLYALVGSALVWQVRGVR